MEEIWKDIEGFEGYYQVSNFGRVKSLERIINKRNGLKQVVKEKILSTKSLASGGYPFVCLYSYLKKYKQFYIHRLVAQSFIPNLENKKTVNHKNGIKTDNRVENLEWMSDSENNKHSFRTLGRKTASQIGTKNSNAKLTDKQVLKIREKYKTGKYKYIDLGKEFGCSGEHVSDIIKNKKWKHI